MRTLLRFAPCLLALTAAASGAAPVMLPSEVAGWEEDLTVLTNDYLEKDRSFNEDQRAAFLESIGALRAQLANRAEAEVLVAVARAVASSNNGSTRADILAHPALSARLPFRCYWFEEGLYIVRATPDFSGLLLSRVRTIGGLTAHELQTRVSELIPGNDQWKRYRGPDFMTSTAVLFGLGIIDNPEAVSVVVDTIDGGEADLLLAPVTPVETDTAPEAWQNLSPYFADPTVKWNKALNRLDYPVPLALQHPHDNYWYEYLEDARTLYIQYNRAAHIPGTPFSTFVQFIDRSIRDDEPQRVIVDLRYLTDADAEFGARLFIRLANHDVFAQPGGMVVLTARSTFTAGTAHAAYLKERTAAAFIGQPVGENLIAWTGGKDVVLPHSQLRVHYCTHLNYLSDTGDPDVNSIALTRMHIGDLAPTIVVPYSWVDYLTGRDATMDAALAYAP